MKLETLETRQHLSSTGALGGSTLFVFGDANPNTITVKKSGDNIVCREKQADGSFKEFYKTKASKVQTIKILAKAGSDHVEVDDFIKATVYINGGDGADDLKAGGLLCYVYGQDINAKDSNDDHLQDTLRNGGYGTTYLFGQGGKDRFFLDRSSATGASGQDFSYGGSGEDYYFCSRDKYIKHNIIGGSGVDVVNFSKFGKRALINLRGEDFTAVRDGDQFNDRYNISRDVEVAIGTPYSDFITCDPNSTGRHSLAGGEGNDSMFGGGGFDQIQGDGGDDLISGDKGDDFLLGVGGNDTIYGSKGADTVLGGADNDKIYGNDGADRLYGEGGNDTVQGDGGLDLIVGGSGNDELRAIDGFDGDFVFGGNDDGKLNGSDSAFVDRSDGLLFDVIVACNHQVFG